MAGGRPKKYTKEVKQDILAKFEKYIDETEIPIIAEFAYLNNIIRQKLYEFPEFCDTIKRAIDKKESTLESLALRGKINVTMAIFSLKQLGWKDKQEIDHNQNGEWKLTVKIVDENGEDITNNTNDV